MRAIRICCVCMAIALIPASHSQSLRADERLDALIQNVEAAEGRIRHIDIEFVTTVTNGAHAVADHQSPLGETTVSHQVVQGIAYSDINAQTIREKERTLPERTYRSEYDGRMERFDSGTGEGTVRVGSLSSPLLFVPHRNLGDAGRSQTPLAWFLRGYDSPPPDLGSRGDANPLPAEHPKTYDKVEYEGEVELNGLKCEKVSLTLLNKKTRRAHMRKEIWLAKERSWLPVRSTCLLYEVSDKIPISFGTAEDLREVEHGVWFPFRTVYTSWHTPTLKESGREELMWSREIKIERVSLRPEYPIEYFRQIEFADGTKVTEYAGRQKGRTYVVGATEAPTDGVDEGPWYARVPLKKVIPGLLALLVIAYAIRAGRRTRVTQAD